MTMQKLRLALVIILVVLVVVLIIQNREPVVTRVFLWSPEMPRFVLLGLTLVVGGLAGFALGRSDRFGGGGKSAGNQGGD